jgi:transposase
MIRSVKDQGLSINEISRRQGISRTTFRRYLKSGKVPQYHRDPVGSMIEPFLPLLREVIDQHNLSAVSPPFRSFIFLSLLNILAF